MVKKRTFLESSVRQAATTIKKEEHEKECDQAAALIQRNFRKHSEGRASTFSLKSSYAALVSSVLGDSSATTIALSFDNDDDISENHEINTEPEKRSRNHFGGNFAAGAAGLIGVAVVSGMMGGAPVDEGSTRGMPASVSSSQKTMWPE